MRNIRETFQNDKTLFPWLANIVASPQWAQCVPFIRAQLQEASPSTDNLQGAKMFEAAMVLLAEPDTPAPTRIATGLAHDLDSPKAAAKKKPTPEPKAPEPTPQKGK